ncbi:MAG: hydrogenase maturation protease [Gemmatimonadetes bacterium]|nr:hydrogenase maturation protease [Gemmatimonadota bacterium]
MPSPDVPEVLFTSHGYLVLQADVARTYFPGDTILALKRDRELWLLPTRGAAAGGLVLKQRNLEGDRSVLVREVLEDAPVVGTRAAIWDAREGVLRVALIGAA